VIDFVAGQTQLVNHVQHDPPFMRSPGLNNINNDSLAAQLQAAVQAIAGNTPSRCGVSFGTDAALFGAAGVPCVVFGPGSIAQAHTADEWVPLAEVEQASAALFRFIVYWDTKR
jgi:acetylornithine deacetylase